MSNIFVKGLLALVKAHPEMLTWALRQFADWLDAHPAAVQTFVSELTPKQP